MPKFIKSKIREKPYLDAARRVKCLEKKFLAGD
jgi:hypothetical protein